MGESITPVVNRYKYILYPEFNNEKKVNKIEPMKFEGGKEPNALRTSSIALKPGKLPEITLISVVKPLVCGI